MKSRVPQLKLRLDAAAPATDAAWHAGTCIAYLGETLRLTLDTACNTPTRIGTELHLPLPPAATPRQIRDTAESWLRDEALRIFTEKSALATRQAIAIKLVFGKRSDWVKRDGNVLRCHWRLIEQPLPVIMQVLEQAANIQPVQADCDDLFSFA